MSSCRDNSQCVRTWVTDSICYVKDGSCRGIDNLIGPVWQNLSRGRGQERGVEHIGRNESNEGPGLGRRIHIRLKNNRWAVGLKVKYLIVRIDSGYTLTSYESDRPVAKFNSRTVWSVFNITQTVKKLHLCAPENFHRSVGLPVEDKGSDVDYAGSQTGS